MLESALVRRNATVKTKITVKGLVSVALVALAVVLPQIVHFIAGASGGVRWLPMYLPVLIAGCVLGTYWGLGVGIMSPVVSFLITSAMSDPMPALARLPFMVAELAVFAVVSGLFSKHIAANKWLAFPAVLLSCVAGRTAFILLVAIFQNVGSLTVALVWSQIQTGLIGLVLQAVLVPFIVMGIQVLCSKDN